MIPPVPQCIAAICLIVGMLPTNIHSQSVPFSEQDSLYLRQLRKTTIGFYGVNYASMDSAGEVYLAESHRLGSTKNKISALQLLGTSQLETGNFGEALEYFLESLTLAEEIESSSYTALAYNNIAATFHFENRLEDALGYYLKALPGFEAERLKPRSAQVLYNIAIIYQDTGIRDSSKKYYQEGIKKATEYEDLRSLADLYNGLGNLVMDAEEDGEARLYLSRALEYAQKIGDPQRSFYPLLNLGTYAIDGKEFDKASIYLSEAREIAYNLESLDMEIDAEKDLSRLDSATSNYQSAYGHLLALASLREEQARLEQESNLALLQEEFDSKQKELELRANERLISEQEQSLQLKSFLNLGLGLVVGLVALIAIGYWRLSNARKQHAQVLVKLNDDKDKMLHAVAHDLQSPFVNIRGLTDILLAESNSESTDKILGIVMKELDKSDHLVKSLLDLESIESGDIPLNIEPISMASLLFSVEQRYSRLAEKKNIQVSAQGEAAVIHTDRGFLERILDNLITNAIKFSRGGTAVNVSIAKEQPGIVIRVKDEGPGFSQRDQLKMYGRFQRLTAQPTSGEPSIGLGLAITKALVERLNGNISLVSQPGEGAEFAILIPGT